MPVGMAVGIAVGMAVGIGAADTPPPEMVTMVLVVPLFRQSKIALQPSKKMRKGRAAAGNRASAVCTTGFKRSYAV